MDFFINKRRSEFVGRCEDETLGRITVFIAALSTFSLPGMSMCPGAHERDRGVIGGEGS